MPRAEARATAGQRRIRCAVYTRKSSEEGLEQAFNSLQAQREACEAFISSQRHEGWSCLPDLFDDGGLSGGTMERPALQLLLAAIRGGRVDAVVVYKVDRLTRSLADFAKIVEVFDAEDVSFVSVTQQFNTTTSMGRLTLNVLLSFAQFERDVTGERIRDKIAASKQKGMWMGGNPPLGYDVQNRSLVVNPDEAASVQAVFDRYLALGSVGLLRDVLTQEGVRSKQRVSVAGRRWGGAPLARGALYTMLRNRLYLGEITHKDRSYPGQHAPIIERVCFDRVQATLDENAGERTTGRHSRCPSLLAGLLFDAEGRRMSPSHANKQGKRYRYYLSQSLITAKRIRSDSGQRIPAAEIEQLVVQRVCRFLQDSGAVFDGLSRTSLTPTDKQLLCTAVAGRASIWTEQSPAEQRTSLLELLARVELSCPIVIRVKPSGLVLFGHATASETPSNEPGTNETTIDLTVETALRRIGQGKTLLVQAPGQQDASPNASLLRLLGQAYRLQAAMLSSQENGLGALSQQAGVTASYVTRLLRLCWLAPDIVQAILDGKQPPALTSTVLMRKAVNLPVAWAAQRDALGFSKH